LVGIILEQRLSAAAAEVLGDDQVYFSGRNAWRNDLRYQLVRLPNANAGLAHETNFAF
jgi:hypothetical protein